MIPNGPSSGGSLVCRAGPPSCETKVPRCVAPEAVEEESRGRRCSERSGLRSRCSKLGRPEPWRRAEQCTLDVDPFEDRSLEILSRVEISVRTATSRRVPGGGADKNVPAEKGS